MDELARVIAEAHGYDWEDFSEDQRMWHRKAANAVRAYLESDEVVCRVAVAISGAPFPTTRALNKARAALQAAGGKQDVR